MTSARSRTALLCPWGPPMQKAMLGWPSSPACPGQETMHSQILCLSHMQCSTLVIAVCQPGAPSGKSLRELSSTAFITPRADANGAFSIFCWTKKLLKAH